MKESKFFLVQIKKTNDIYEKGVVVKDTLEDAKQGFHAYFGAYGYDHDSNTNFVECLVVDDCTNVLMREVDDRRPVIEQVD